MRIIPTLLAILVIIGGTAGLIFLMIKLKPEAEKEEREKSMEWVEVMEVKMEDVTLKIPSQGLVRPVRETVATSEVSGQVKSINPKFKVGGEFKVGDVMLELDDTDYQAALAQAKAEVAAAKLDLELELSRQAQAIRDWKELGDGREQSALSRREPQVTAARARVAAAEKAVEKADKDVKRTRFIAKYDGRVKSKSVELGTHVTMGSRVGEIYATDEYEVRLPLSLDNFSFVDLYAPGEAVSVYTDISGKRQEWKAKILRTEGQIDRASRSVYLVAGLSGNSKGFDRENLLAPDLFVKADITGRTLKGVVKLPRRAFVKPDHVLVLEPGNKLKFRKVTIEHRDRDFMYVSEGLNSGEKICTTALAAVTDGMEVRLLGEEEEAEQNPNSPDKSPLESDVEVGAENEGEASGEPEKTDT